MPLGNEQEFHLNRGLEYKHHLQVKGKVDQQFLMVLQLNQIILDRNLLVVVPKAKFNLMNTEGSRAA